MLNCSKCLRLLPEELFSKRGDSPRGRMSACKDCEKKRGAENRVKFKEKNRAWHKEHAQDPMYKAYRREYMRERYRKNGMTPEQKEKKRIRQKEQYQKSWRIKMMTACRGQTKQAVRKGILIQKPCEYPNCKHKDLKVEIHHWDYTQPLLVTWLCSQHHGLADQVRKAKEKYPPNF